MISRPAPIVGRAGNRRGGGMQSWRPDFRTQEVRDGSLAKADLAVRNSSRGAAAPGLLSRLRTVDQLAQECPALSVRTLRYWISRADELGLEAAVYRIGRKVLLDPDQLECWLKRQNT